MVEQVTIIGNGQMATVCAVMLADRGIPVRMWGANREHIEAMKATRENRKYLPGLRIPERVSFTTDAAAASVVNDTRSGMRSPGRYLRFSRVAFIASICSRLAPHMRTGIPRSASMTAQTVAIWPFPMMVTCSTMTVLKRQKAETPKVHPRHSATKKSIARPPPDLLRLG